MDSFFHTNSKGSFDKFGQKMEVSDIINELAVRNDEIKELDGKKINLLKTI